MRKLFRFSVAACLTVSILLSQAAVAFADEAYGPGFINGVPIEQAENPTESATQTTEETTAAETEAQTTPSTEETSGNQEAADGGESGVVDEATAAEQAALLASLPHLQTTMMTDANVWSQPFQNDAEIVVDGQGFRSMSVFLTNIVGNVLYRTYTTSQGWSPWVMNGQQTTMYEQGVYVEAVQMRFSGYVNNLFDIYYCATLEDGTTTDWAKNGTSAGTMGTGHYMTGLRMTFFGKTETWPNATEKPLISANQDGIQYIDGEMRYVNGDGGHFTGWAWQGNDRYYFVNTFPVTGWQYIDGYKYYFDETGKLVQDLEPIIGANGPYLIKINKQMNCMTIYVKDGANGFIIPLKTFLTSTGPDTPLGTFSTPEKYRWRDMNHGIYTQYATRIYKGFLIHSILYSSPNAMTLDPTTYNYLSIAESAGCVRLVTRDAKWVYDHCPLGTTVTIYNSPVPGPYERPAIEQIIPSTQTWDPTDPNIAQNQ